MSEAEMERTVRKGSKVPVRATLRGRSGFERLGPLNSSGDGADQYEDPSEGGFQV
jgi:hypothetical protein